MTKNLRLITANHNLWCMKINNFVNGNTEVIPITSDQNCELGKWIATEGLLNYGHISEVKILDKEHKQLHSIARNIVQLKNSGKIKEAQQQLFLIQESSDKIMNLLNKIIEEIN